MRHFANGEYLCLSVSDKKASLWTKDGVRLTAIAERATGGAAAAVREAGRLIGPLRVDVEREERSQHGAVAVVHRRADCGGGGSPGTERGGVPGAVPGGRDRNANGLTEQ